MHVRDVPQDRAESLAGEKKPVYAVNERGEYITTMSSGWEVEEVVLEQAIEEFKLLADGARAEFEAGTASPLKFHMYNNRMDILVLAQSTGFFRWQVKRHFRMKNFLRLSEKKMQRYSDALGLTLSQLRVVE